MKAAVISCLFSIFLGLRHVMHMHSAAYCW